MKPSQSYFVFNKESDYRRGWGENLRLTGSGIRAERTDRPCVFWSRLLDCREKETVWHRMTMDSRSLGDASVRFTFYCAESRSSSWQGKSRDLDELLRAPELSDEDRRQLSAPFLARIALNPRDILLHELRGRYVWFRAELLPGGGESPEIGNLRLRFPRESWLAYLPEVYQADPAGKDFTERFLGIFQSLYDDLDEEIRAVARCFDPDAVGREYLEWLAGWLDVEDAYLWTEEQLRTLVRRGMELYRIRGTRRYVCEMVKLYTGQEPWVVEHSEIEPYLTDAAQAATLRELYGESPYMVTLVLDASALASNDAHRALLHIIDSAKPAWIEVNLVVLKPYIFLDKYSYLGMNSALNRYRPLNLDGYSALPFTELGGDSKKTS